VSGKSREGEYKRTIVKVSKLANDIKTGGHNYPRDKPIGNLFTGWAVSGIEMARARFRHFNGKVRLPPKKLPEELSNNQQ